jgi:hypothetical protein
MTLSITGSGFQALNSTAQRADAVAEELRSDIARFDLSSFACNWP